MVFYKCLIKNCLKSCKSPRGLTQHVNAFHRRSPQDNLSDADFQKWTHPHLTAHPCDKDGHFISPEMPPPAQQPLDATPDNPFYPFSDRLSFEFANYHFSQEQSSAASIDTALELWAAQSAKHGFDDVPWKSADEMYKTIDKIQQGSNPWKSVPFRYQGPVENGQKWMTQEFTLITRDIRCLLHEQIACADFDGHWDYVPFMEFNKNGDRVWTSLMSGNWAAKQADKISADVSTHGAMLVSIVAGSDKTVASIGTGNQEFHPVYIGPGNVDNPTRRAHGGGLQLCAFLPIPKVGQHERTTVEYQQFFRQLFHACLAFIYDPLKHAMTSPEVVRCPDGRFRRAIYSIGPYIADYPEQVWLTAIVKDWCPRCDAHPRNLDDRHAHLRSHQKTEFLLEAFEPNIVWDQYGIRSDVVPFTYQFPRADIHELITPDLLHQLIKGVFKDHLVTWVQEYIILYHGKTHGQKIIQDIDRRISSVPAYAGLRRFPEGRNFKQWTGDDSKALMKVYIAAICGHVPQEIVQTLSAFMNCFYIVRRNTITTSDIGNFQNFLADFYRLRDFFITAGVRKDISLPRQHALIHYSDAIELFGSPNGTCTSQTEAMHKTAVKDPWRRSNRNHPIGQMTLTVTRADKLLALWRVFKQRGMLDGSLREHMAQQFAGCLPSILPWRGVSLDEHDAQGESLEGNIDEAPISGARRKPDIRLPDRAQSKYPSSLPDLAAFIGQPDFPRALRAFIYEYNHSKPNPLPPSDDSYNGPIHVFHSAKVEYYAPSDLCGAGGMHRELIRANPNYDGSPRYDTVFVSVGEDDHPMGGLLVARVWLLFSYFDPYKEEDVPCALVSWFIHPNKNPKPDEVTGMWKLQRERDHCGKHPIQVIHLNTILRGAHLLPCYGEGFLPDDLRYTDALDAWESYLVNQFIDHHTHELILSL